MGKSKKTTLSIRSGNDDLKVNVLSGDPPFFTELQLEKLCNELFLLALGWRWAGNDNAGGPNARR